jgi:ABC-type transport system involved in cytochrome c biogenesis permease subunit
MARRMAVVLSLVLSTTACFHQAIHSGLAPSTTVVENEFVATWLWGIVPAKPIDVRQSCPSGVATVETEQSFVNGLVGVVTLGIYTPQRVRITCAS